MAQLANSQRIAEIHVGASPDWQVTAFGSFWVANDDAGVVQRINVQTNRVVGQTKVSNPCAGLVAAAGSVWSPDCDNHMIDRLAPDDGRVIARVPATLADSEAYTAGGANHVWFVASAGKLSGVNPSTNRVDTTIAVPAGSVAVAYGFGSLWVSDPVDDLVVRVDPERRKVVARIHTGSQPRFLTAGEGAVWVLDQGTGDVTRIDPGSLATRSIRTDSSGSGGCIATGFGAVWLTIAGSPVTRIDADTGAVTAQFKGEGGDCIGTGAGSVWLSNIDIGTVWRIRPFD